MNKAQSSELTVERCTDAAEWDQFVEANDGSPFTLWGWGEALATYGHDRWYLVVRNGGGIVGALPLIHMESRLFDSQLVSPPFGERGSLVLNGVRPAEATRALLKRTKRLADELDVDFVSLRGSDVDEGLPEGFTEERRFVTFRVDLREGSDAVWEGLKDSRQRQVRQAEDASLTYRVGDSLDDLKRYYRLYLRSNRGHGSPPHSFEFYRTLWEELAPEHLHLGMVELDGAPVNAIIDLSLGSSIHQWGVITDYEFRDLNGGSLALWRSLDRACADGYDVYDMGRTREGSGVYMFKKSFGGRKAWYDDLHYFPDGPVDLPDPDDDTYDRAKRIWRRLPIPVTRVIGPSIRKGISL